MKRFAKILVLVLGVIILLVMIPITVVFIRPGLVLNPESLTYMLNRGEIFKTWSWENASIEIEWESWNHRKFTASFKGFCFDYENDSAEVSSCLDRILWNTHLKYSFSEGVSFEDIDPLTLVSSKTRLKMKKNTSPPEEESPPDIKGPWSMIWEKKIPRLDLSLNNISVLSDGKDVSFNLFLQKDLDNLLVKAFDFELQATPQKFDILGPPEYKLPFELFKGVPLNLRGFKLSGRMEEEGIPLVTIGKIESLDFNISAFLELPLKDSFDSIEVRKSFFRTLKARLDLKNIRKNFSQYTPSRFSTLPAPFNVMEGDLVSIINVTDANDSNSVLIKSETSLNFKSPHQVLEMKVFADSPIDVVNFSPGLVQIEVDFEDVKIQLPRLSKKTLPPQFTPDGRFVNTSPEKDHKKIKKGKKKSHESTVDINLHLQASGEEAMHFKTNLLDEPLRLNFDLLITLGNLEKGFVEILPLKTTVFKRPIEVKSLHVKFHRSQSPVIRSTVVFPLPAYKITLHAEGPMEDPRYVFSSVPPLPQDDIYAVLLFGRPLGDLSSDDKQAAQKSSKVLARGLFSLSALYFLAGSPIEYVGIDPDSKRASASIGLGRKTSLQLGAGGGEGKSGGVRHSLGKGWYLDTSVQGSSVSSQSTSPNYGVMLERIIAY